MTEFGALRADAVEWALTHCSSDEERQVGKCRRSSPGHKRGGQQCRNQVECSIQ